MSTDYYNSSLRDAHTTTEHGVLIYIHGGKTPKSPKGSLKKKVSFVATFASIIRKVWMRNRWKHGERLVFNWCAYWNI